MTTPRHLLVPVDFDDVSDLAVRTAMTLADRFHARLTLLHVLQLPRTALALGLEVPEEQLHANARRNLEAVKARVGRRHPDVVSVVVPGEPWSKIVELAKSLDADLIVMGTHGRHGLPRMFLGSVAERVLRASPVPVLAVPSASVDPVAPAVA